MESEENKIEVDELDLGFFFNSCKSSNMLGVYRLGKKSNEIKKMICFGWWTSGSPFKFIYLLWLSYD